MNREMTMELLQQTGVGVMWFAVVSFGLAIGLGVGTRLFCTLSGICTAACLP